MNSLLSKIGVEYPFPGLRPFVTGEEHLFFGRESQSDAMIDKLRSTRFLAVTGPSGSGKSSLVNCGLCMGLYSGLMAEAGTAWRIASCRPGNNPIRSLASALAGDGILFSNFENTGMSLLDMIDSNLHMSKMGIVDVYEQSRQPDGTNLLIIVDQFEELFRFQPAIDYKDDEQDSIGQQAVAFVKLLLSAISHSDYPIYIVLTMRSDFLGACTQYEGLAEAINQGQYLVPRMSREQRRLAISGPIAVAGTTIDDALLTKLVNETSNNPDQLSILQHALNRIWAHWRDHNKPDTPLSLQNFSAIGSMERALDRHAEAAFLSLKTQHQKTIAEKLFKALTDKTTHPEGIRRPTAIKVLEELTDSSREELTRVIDVFREPSRSFLVPGIKEPLNAGTIVDISHESLMRMWQRLILWSDEESASAIIYNRLANTATLHSKNKAGLWRDPDLQLALEWRHHNEPNDTWAARVAPGFEQAMRFLDESRVNSDEEKAASLLIADQLKELEHAKAISKEQAQRLLAEKAASSRQKKLTAGITIGFVATMWLSGLYYLQIKEMKKTYGNKLVVVNLLKKSVADKVAYERAITALSDVLEEKR